MGRGTGSGKGKGGFIDVFQEAEDVVKCAICGVCIMLISGPVLLIVGISYIGDATTDSRGMAIDSFKTAVNEWSTVDRAEFDNLDQVISVKMPGNISPPPPLRKVENAGSDPLFQRAKGDVGAKDVDGDTSWATWEPLFYTSQVTVASYISERYNGAIELHDDTPGAGSSYSPAWTDNGELVGCQDVTESVEPCQTSCASSGSRRRRSSACTTCRSKCSGRGGELQSDTSSTCIKRLTLTEVNLVAHKSSDSLHPWSFDGIAYTVPQLDTADSFQGASHQPPTGGTYTSAPGRCPLAPPGPPPTSYVPLTVRSENDPVVKAAKATSFEVTSSGAFDFGNTQAENAAIGSTLVTIGGIITGLPCFVAFCMFKLIGNRRKNQHNQLQSPQTMGSTPEAYAPPQFGAPMQAPVANAGNPVYSGIPGVGQSPFPSNQPASGVTYPGATTYATPQEPQQMAMAQLPQPQPQQPMMAMAQPMGAMPVATATAMPQAQQPPKQEMAPSAMPQVQQLPQVQPQQPFKQEMASSVPVPMGAMPVATATAMPQAQQPPKQEMAPSAPPPFL